MSREQSPAVDVRAVVKTFGSGEDTVRALDGVTVPIRENEFFTLLGPSGCGKTTLLRLIAGFEQPTEGTILLGGEDITHLPPFQRPVNTVFQSYALFPHMTVAQNVAFGLEMQGIAKTETAQRVERMLSLVKLAQLAGRKPAQLSGGQQQRVALARALANHPKVLLLDEPLSALDLKLRKEMQIELKRLQHETGITFVFVTHDQEEALTMSDRIAVMEAGQILQVGSPTEIYEHPTHRFVADFIGEINFLPAQLTAMGNGVATVQIAGGIERRASVADGIERIGQVTVAVRPERVSLRREVGRGALPGAVENVIYFGTDTIYHLRTEDEHPFTVRMQNREGAASAFAVGDRLGIDIPDGALQVLRD